MLLYLSFSIKESKYKFVLEFIYIQNMIAAGKALIHLDTYRK
jgi:hypothetical protein